MTYHVNVVTGSSSTVIGTGLCFDGDGLCWAYGFAQLNNNKRHMQTLVEGERAKIIYHDDHLLYMQCNVLHRWGIFATRVRHGNEATVVLFPWGN